MKILLANKSKKYKAFSFLEVIISVFIISVGLVSSVGLIATSLSGSMDSRKQIVASLLAQEGIELVRNIRDNNWMDNDPITTSFSHGIDSTGHRIDRTMIDVSTSTTYALYYHSTNGYVHSSVSANPTPFSRKIIISVISDDERTIVSAVRWGATPFPAGEIKESSCNTTSKCAFAKITLNSWGE